MNDNQSGVLLTQSKAEYEADDSRVRASDLKRFLGTHGPADYYKHREAQRKAKAEGGSTETPIPNDRTFGSLFHELILEGRVGWVELKEGDRALHNEKYRDALIEAGWTLEEVPTGEVYKSGKKKGSPKTKTVIKGDGKPVLKAEEIATLNEWSDAIFDSPRCVDLLETPRMPEQVIHWEFEVGMHDSVTDQQFRIVVPLKCAVDIYASELMACLKTTRADSQRQYRWECHKFHYPMQAAVYLDGRSSLPGVGECPFQHLVLLKGSCFAYRWTLHQSWIRVGRQKYLGALENYALGMHREAAGCEPRIAWPDAEEAKSGEYLTADSKMLDDDGISHSTFDPGA